MMQLVRSAHLPFIVFFLFKEGFEGGGGDLISFVLKLWFKLAYENLFSYFSSSINIFLFLLNAFSICVHARVCV